MLNISQQGDATFSFCKGVPQTSNSGQLVLSMYFCTLWLTVALVCSQLLWFNTPVFLPRGSTWGCISSKLSLWGTLWCVLAATILGLSPSLSTCPFECETVQGALTTSSPVLREAEKAALLFSVACRMGNLPVWQSQVSTNNLSPSLNEASFLGSQVILGLCTLKEVGQ